ncbi:MAG: glycosyltransferase family 1 protein, partial [Bacillota bacterium]|nr:glycosyltransferase family 1 protein [Bacillota bacterium]
TGDWVSGEPDPVQGLLKKGFEPSFYRGLSRDTYKLWAALGLFSYRRCFREEADVTVFFDPFLPPGVRGKRVVFLHDLAPLVRPGTLRPQSLARMRLTLRQTCRRADRIVTVSQFSKGEIMMLLGVPEERISVLYWGVDGKEFRPCRDPAVEARYGLQGGYFLFIGTLEPRKNVTGLVRAFGRFKRETGSAARLVLAGSEGPRGAELRSAIAASGCEREILLPGYVAREDVPPLLSGALAFVFPSFYEGFGLPVLEAMACGTPVLCGNGASLPEVAGDGALLAPPEDEGALAAALGRLEKDEELRKTLREKGMERAKRFSWENAARQLYEIAEDVYGTGGQN